jgi:hypothetical protein
MKFYTDETIGGFFETLVGELLAEAGFTNIRRLPRGHRDFDYLADRDNRLHIIQAKGRNHTFCDGREKDDVYNLHDSDEKVERAMRTAMQYAAIPAWVTGTINSQLVSAWWGFHSELKSLKQVPMKPSDRARYRVLCKDREDIRIDPGWTNNENVQHAVMFCIPPYTEANELIESPRPVPTWAWSWAKHRHGVPTCGLSFPRATAEESFDACYEDLMGYWDDMAVPVSALRFIRDTDGFLHGPLRKGAPPKIVRLPA